MFPIIIMLGKLAVFANGLLNEKEPHLYGYLEFLVDSSKSDFFYLFSFTERNENAMDVYKMLNRSHFGSSSYNCSLCNVRGLLSSLFQAGLNHVVNLTNFIQEKNAVSQ